MSVEFEQRERAKELLHDTVKHFEKTSEGGDFDFYKLKSRMEKQYANQRGAEKAAW